MASARAPQGLEERLRWIEAWLASFEERIARIERGQAARPPATWQPVAPPVPEPAQARESAPARMDLESVLGGNWLAKAGMVVLVLGVVFFLTYAFEQGWINRPARIAMGVVGGLALAAFGDFLFTRRRYGVYPQVLAGGGVVIVYFSLYAAYAFPDYRAVTGFTLELDAILLGLTALALAGYATWRNMPVLASEAVLLAGLTTLFAQTWEAFTVFYVLGLAVAVIAATVVRGWHYVAPLVLLVSYGDLFLNLAMETGPWPVLWTAAGLLVVFTAAAYVLRPAAPADWVSCQVVAAGSFLGSWGVAMYCFDLLDLRDAQGPVTGALAIASLALAFVPVVQLRIRYAWGVAASILALAWPPIQFDETAVVLAWSALVAAASAWYFVRPARALPWFAAAGAGLLSLFLYAVEAGRIAAGELGDVAGLLPFGAATVALVVAWWTSSRSERDEARQLARIVFALALLPPLVYSAVALDGFVVSIVWAAEALLLVLLGFVLALPDLRIGGLAVFGLVLGRIFIADMAALRPEVRIVTFLAVGSLILVASFFFARARRSAPPPRAAATPRQRVRRPPTIN